MQTINYTTFEAMDLNIYNEISGATATSAVVKGAGEVIQNRFCFHLMGKTAAQIADGDTDLTPIYKMRQVNARKRTGTGETFAGGDNVYYYPSDSRVSSTATGTAGSDYYYCGTCKKPAAASDLVVLMEFDGTRYTEDI